VIKQQAHQQSVSASLGCIRLVFQGGNLGSRQQQRFRLFRPDTRGNFLPAALIVNALTVTAAAAGMHGFDQLALCRINHASFDRQPRVGFHRGEIHISAADGISLQQQPLIVSIHQSPGDTAPGGGIVMQMMNPQAFLCQIFGKEFKSGTVTAQRVGR